MYAKSVAALFFLAQLAAGQAPSTTSTSAPTTGTSLPDLVSALDECIYDCLPEASTAFGCASTDIQCLCSADVSSVTDQLTPCITSSCALQVALGAASDLEAICDAAQNSPDPAAVASASNIVEDALASATAEPTHGSDDDDNAANSLAIGANGILVAAVALILAA